MREYRFILGGGGTGKTAYIYRWLTQEAEAHPTRRYYLFVPEQNTLKAQQGLIAASKRHGLLNLDVLSFQLLAYRVMEELGIQRPDVLDEMSRSLFLRRACQEVKGELKVYGSKLGAQGFINQLKALLSEFGQYDVSGTKLAAAEAAVTSPLLRDKLADVRLILSKFHELIGEGRAAGPEELPKLLLKQLDRSHLLDDAVLVFDGYTGYTPVQLLLISAFMERAAQLSFAVTIPREAEPYRREIGDCAIADIWWLSKETIAKLCALGEKNGLRRGDDIYPAHHSPAPALQLVAAEDPTEEVRFAAARIREETMHRGQAGLRFRRIAVAVSDPEGYQELIRRAFTQAELPFFLDDKSDSTGSAAVELLRAALAVLAGGWNYEDVLRYLRNPLLMETDGAASEADRAEGEAEAASQNAVAAQPQQAQLLAHVQEQVSTEPQPAFVWQQISPREAVDLIDNYVRAKGLRGRSRFADVWQTAYKGAETLNLELLNAAKQALLEPLFALQEAFAADRHVSGRVAALRNLLLDVHAKERTQAFAERLRAEALLRAAEENERFLLLTEELFERLEGLLGEEVLSMAAFIELIDAGFADLKAGMIPQTMDMLLIGDLKRSRFDDIDSLYILGANDGLLPSAVSGGGLFTDRERVEIQQLDIDMAPADRLDSCIQNFYLYLLMHKPKQALTISYTKSGRDGRAMKPSELIARLLESERGLSVQRAAQFQNLTSEADALRLFAAAAGNQAIEQVNDANTNIDIDTKRKHQQGGTQEAERNRLRFLTLYNHLRRSSETSHLTELILQAAFFAHRKERLPKDTAQALYGDVLYGSVTRIEQFERCPYAHFLKYGLGLLERQQFDIEAVDIGNLYHMAIDLVFRRLEAQRTSLQEADPQLLQALSAEAVEEVAERYNDSVMQSSARNRYLNTKVKTITERTLWALQNQAKKGDFRTYGCELPFRLKEAGLELHGRIDRVDVAVLKPEPSESEAAAQGERQQVGDVPSEPRNLDETLAGQQGDKGAQGRSRIAVRVIDYKSGRTRFDLSAVYQGMQLQLVTYMNLAMLEAERSGKQAVPAGLFYYHIEDPLVDYDTLPEAAAKKLPQEDSVLKQQLTALRMNGLVNEDLEVLSHLDKTLANTEGTSVSSDVIPVKLKNGVPDARASQVANQLRLRQLGQRVSDRLRADAGRILSGEIDAAPYRESQRSGCDFCPYHSICGFDSRIRGFSYRQLPRLSKEAVWEKLSQDYGRAGQQETEA